MISKSEDAIGEKGATVVIEATTGRVAAGGAGGAERALAASAFQSQQEKAQVQIGAVEFHTAR